MRRLLAALLAALLLIAAPASATRLTGKAGSALAQFQRWIDAARMPTPSGRMAIAREPCPVIAAARACTSSSARLIYMGPRAGRHELLHELGHQFDYRMPRWARRRFLVILGRPGADWLLATPSPSEQFADAYATCAVSPSALPVGFDSIVGYDPTAAQHRAVCVLLLQVGRSDRGEFTPPRSKLVSR